eukprot:TRINITY_DN22_c0_g1_i2.p1 TRINITY_DN22_c0_g1~~TRINITY_DN22_c0_g1_i2.p1  ORF type:complete len:121 (-),score=47.16 TRINITY_DN22_c0_g1_i2:33-395(-)
MCIRDRYQRRVRGTPNSNMAGGGMNDMVANMVAEQMEKAVDAQMEAVERDMHDLEGARKKRMKELREFESKKREWKAKGHGTYEEIHEQDFFGVCKQSECIAVHFFRDSTRCGSKPVTGC